MLNKNTQNEDIPSNVKEVILMTNLPEDYQIVNNTLSIPSNYDQENLNKLIKKLLKLTEKKSFIFFIENKILDKPLHNFLLENPEILKASEEKPIEISYSFQLEEPKLINTIKEDEWIRKITLRKNANLKNELEYFCVGLFNSECTIYNKNQEKFFKIQEDANEDNLCELLHDVAFYSRVSGDNILLKASRNENENIKIYSLDLNKGSYNQIYTVGKNDSEYVNCLSVNSADTNYFCAGDTSGNLKIFKIPENNEKNLADNNPNIKNKKRKIEINYLNHELNIEKCHENKEIRNILWLNNQQILTSGDNFHLKIWNIHTKTNYLSLNANHKYVSSISNYTDDSIITGHDDGRIKFWDLRSGKISNIFSGHKNFVSAIDVDVTDYSKFVSIGYDSCLNVWDVRSNKAALFNIQTDSEKNYGLCYNTSDYILCGGESANINVFSSTKN